MLEAVIFDFDGVIVDSEPLHLEYFRQVMRAQYGVELTNQQYYDEYVAYTDAECFAKLAEKHRIPCSDDDIARLIAQKTALMRKKLAESIKPLPGVIELMRSLRASGLGLAVCSSALREEIEASLSLLGVADLVQLIVSADDVPAGKPDPAGYNLTRKMLAKTLGSDLPAGSCLAIEDSPGGVSAAKSAHLAVLAVTNSVPADRLSQADLVVESLTAVTIHTLRRLVGP